MYGTVSVIMPAYNVGGYIEESIKSVQNQTYKNWELIIINDGSTDNTPDIIYAMASDPRIKIYSQKNGGVSRARNKGLELATGEYIAFLDGDDLWLPSFLEELLNVKGSADIAYCGYTRMYKDGNYKPKKCSFPSGWVLSKILQSALHLHLGSLIINKSFLDNKNLHFAEDCRYVEDDEFVLKALTTAQVQSVPKYLMIYRIRPGSAMQQKWAWKKRIDGIYAIIRVKEYVYKELNGSIDLNFWASKKIFKFIWHMIRYGYHEDAQKLIDGEFADDLARMDRKMLNFGNKLKYFAVISQNTKLWQLITFLTFKKSTA